MAGLVNIFQALLARIGKRLGYDADQVIIDHGGKDIMCAAAVDVCFRRVNPYSRTRINVAKGERWFCTEEEAQAAGWRRSKR